MFFGVLGFDFWNVVGDASYELSTLRLLSVLLQEMVGVSLSWCVVGVVVGLLITTFVPVGDDSVVYFNFWFCFLYRPRCGILQRTKRQV